MLNSTLLMPNRSAAARGATSHPIIFTAYFRAVGRPMGGRSLDPRVLFPVACMTARNPNRVNFFPLKFSSPVPCPFCQSLYHLTAHPLYVILFS